METIVLSLGGSIIVPDEINTDFLKKFKQFILKYVKKGFRFIIICGGGKTCRKYQKAAKKISNVDQYELDCLGIEITKMNAFFVKQLFGKNAYEKIITDPHEKIKTGKKIIIGAGWKPGCSTDKDAVILAKKFDADLIVNMFDLDYVYTKDPKKHKDAKPITQLSWDKMLKITGNKWTPGLNAPFCPEAGKLAMKNQLEVVILKGTDLNNLGRLFDGKEFNGTVITSSD